MMTLQNFARMGIAAAMLASAGSSFGAISVFTTNLTGAAEVPPVTSNGTGTATITVDTVLNTMRVQSTFSGLTGNVTVCHIHGITALPFAGNAGVATTQPTFPGFPAGVTAGSYDTTFDMTLASSYNASFITNNGGTTASAFAALIGAMGSGRAYFNVHSSFATGGEVRGYLIPAPSAAGLIGLGGLMALRRRR